MDKSYRWDIFETAKNLYEDTIQKGETFSFDMGQEIQKEIERIIKEKEEFDKNNSKD